MTKADMWNRLEPTDPARTKPFQRGGGFRGTAINATYILKKLTEEFGPCGKGWKFVLEDERIEEGHALRSGDKARVHIVRGHITYRPDPDGVWYDTSPQFGQTMLVDENKNGTFTDEEAPKKSITDCMSKCAVLLGIGADVHLGLFDDSKYVNQRKQEEAEEANSGNGKADGSEMTSSPKTIATAWANETADFISKAPFKTLRELDDWHIPRREKIASVRAHNEAAHKRLIEAIQKRQADLTPLGVG